MSEYVTLSHAWAQVPDELLCDPTISDTAVRIFGVLHRHGQGDWRRTYPSHARIAGLIGRSKRSIRAWIKELEDAGWVDVIPRTTEQGDPDSNAYHLHMVRATERGGVRASQRGGSALGSAPKESNGTRASRNEKEIDRAQLTLVAEQADPKVIAEGRFEKFWDAYPKRNGKRVRKAAAKASWMRLTPDEHVAAWAGVHHYAASGEIPRDAERWLNHRDWEDWQEPAEPTSNGNGHQEVASMPASSWPKGGEW